GSRRTDEGLLLPGDSGDLSSAGNSLGPGAPPPPPLHAPPVGPRHPTASHVEKGTERTWHQTRSLAAALEGIQHYLQQQQQQQHEEQRQQQQQQHEEQRQVEGQRQEQQQQRQERQHSGQPAAGGSMRGESATGMEAV
ncbi:hypothetical protein Agub_g11044, partial [Astrephomene gubernaculifera]